MRRFIALVALAACTEAQSVDPPGELVCSREWQRSFPTSRRPPTDLLFVLDRTPSMADEAAGLAVNAAALADVLAQVEGGLPDLHVAVVTSDLGGAGVPGCAAGDGGRFQGGARCGLDGAYLDFHRLADGTPVQNFSGSFRDALTCLLEVPLSPCPVSQPIGALVRALDGSEPSHDGFRRDDAYLYFVVITDGDDGTALDAEVFRGVSGDTPADLEAAVDQRAFALGASCSPGNPLIAGVHDHCIERSDAGFASIAASVDALRTDDDRWLIGGLIAGPSHVLVVDGGLASVCPAGATTVATGAPRLAALRAALPNRFAEADVCGENWSDILVQLDTGWGAIVNRCAEAVLDLEPAVPGLQVECLANLRDGAGERIAGLSSCATAGTGEMCLRLIDDPVSCPGDGEAAFVVETRGSILPHGSWLDLRCRIPCD